MILITVLACIGKVLANVSGLSIRQADSILEAVIIKSKLDGTNTEINLDGVFIAIGHKPNTDIFKNILTMDNDGYIIANDKKSDYATETSIAGVFAAGDVTDKIYRQAVTSAGTGCMAALDAEKFIDSLE